MPLRFKLLILFAVFGVIPLLIAGVLGYTRSVSTFEGLLARQTDAQAHRIVTELLDRIAMHESDINLLSNNAETQAVLRAVAAGADSARVRQAREGADAYLTAFWTAIHGSFERVVIRDVSNAAVLELGEPVLAPADPRSTQMEQRRAMIPLTRAIRDTETRRTIGYIEYVPQYAQLLRVPSLGSAVGPSGYDMIVDRATGRPLMHPDFDITAAGAADSAWTRVPALVADSGYFAYMQNGTRRIASYAAIEDPKWLVISTTSIDDFTLALLELRNASFLVLLLLAAVTSLAFFLALRRTTRSLEALTAATTRIGQGDFSPRLPPAGTDEVGRLSHAVEEMTRRLRGLVTQVEDSRQMVLLGEFAAHVSHEIRNPLTALKLNLQSLERDTESGVIDREYAGPVAICLREVKRLERVVSGVLTLGRTMQERHTVSVHDLLRELALLVEIQAVEADVAIRLELHADTDRVDADRAALKSAFLNIILNAIEAQPEGGSLELQTELHGAQLCIRFCDGGPGIDRDLRERALRPFFTTKQQGTGLGLSTAGQVIRAHAGTLYFGDPDSGGLVIIELPVQPIAAVAV
jgi:signal transduction histidine kinase